MNCSCRFFFMNRYFRFDNVYYSITTLYKLQGLGVGTENLYTRSSNGKVPSTTLRICQSNRSRRFFSSLNCSNRNRWPAGFVATVSVPERFGFDYTNVQRHVYGVAVFFLLLLTHPFALLSRVREIPFVTDAMYFAVQPHVSMPTHFSVPSARSSIREHTKNVADHG